MSVIYRYEIPIMDRQEVLLPTNALILHVVESDRMFGHLTIWALINTDTLTSTRRTIAIFGTGNPFDHRLRKHIGSVVDSRKLVWHVFEEE